MAYPFLHEEFEIVATVIFIHCDGRARHLSQRIQNHEQISPPQA